MKSIDAITLTEAASILGCSVSTVRRHVLAGRLASVERYQRRALSRQQVERLATEVYDWRRHLNEAESYWVAGSRAAEILGVNRSRVGQLVAQDKIPCVTHADGTRLYRREQLGIVAQAREARRLNAGITESRTTLGRPVLPSLPVTLSTRRSQ